MTTCETPCRELLAKSIPAKANDQYYTNEQLSLIKKEPIPQHVAIIPDGNRRWAKRKSESITEGHRIGADNLITIVKAAKALGIKTLTFYLFSTENWLREKSEVSALMWLLEKFLIEQRQAMIDEGIHFHTIGDLSKLSARVNKTIEECKKATAHCDAINMVAGLNYGGRDELKRAFRAILEDFEAGKVGKGDVSENLISSYLDTAQWPDPDLLIRTSGEHRISNFLLWQMSYAEIYIAEDLWPEFRPDHLFEAVLYYQSRERRLGGG